MKYKIYSTLSLHRKIRHKMSHALLFLLFQLNQNDLNYEKEKLKKILDNILINIY